MITLLHKQMFLDESPIIYNKPFDENFLDDWNQYTGQWWYENGWLNGKNPGNFPGMIVSKADFPGNVAVEFEARTVPPCTHDINVMWNGSWDEKNNVRSTAYVAGVEGWWAGKVGIEKSPDYKLNTANPIFKFEPGRIYFIQAGSIDGHCFICIDGQLIMEVTDPDPIDNQKNAKIGFEAYCSHIQIRNCVVKQIKWIEKRLQYTPEF